MDNETPNVDLFKCFDCGGKGTATWVEVDAEGRRTEDVRECEFCHGTGRIDYSKCERAEAVMGLRHPGGIQLFEPSELGYECPICHTPHVSPDGEPNEYGVLHFSEYKGFMWCPVCNIDIPSFFCVHPSKIDTKEKVGFWRKIFLDFVEEIKRDSDGK